MKKSFFLISLLALLLVLTACGTKTDPLETALAEAEQTKTAVTAEADTDDAAAPDDSIGSQPEDDSADQTDFSGETSAVPEEMTPEELLLCAAETWDRYDALQAVECTEADAVLNGAPFGLRLEREVGTVSDEEGTLSMRESNVLTCSWDGTQEALATVRIYQDGTLYTSDSEGNSDAAEYDAAALLAELKESLTFFTAPDTITDNFQVPAAELHENIITVTFELSPLLNYYLTNAALYYISEDLCEQLSSFTGWLSEDSTGELTVGRSTGDLLTLSLDTGLQTVSFESGEPLSISVRYSLVFTAYGDAVILSEIADGI